MKETCTLLCQLLSKQIWCHWFEFTRSRQPTSNETLNMPVRKICKLNAFACLHCTFPLHYDLVLKFAVSKQINIANCCYWPVGSTFHLWRNLSRFFPAELRVHVNVDTTVSYPWKGLLHTPGRDASPELFHYRTEINCS